MKRPEYIGVQEYPSGPRVVAFCSERTKTVQNLSKTGNCLNQQTAKNDKMSVAPLPTLPVLKSQQARLAADALPEGRVRMCQILSSAAWVEALLDA